MEMCYIFVNWLNTMSINGELWWRTLGRSLLCSRGGQRYTSKVIRGVHQRWSEVYIKGDQRCTSKVIRGIHQRWSEVYIKGDQKYTSKVIRGVHQRWSEVYIKGDQRYTSKVIRSIHQRWSEVYIKGDGPWYYNTLSPNTYSYLHVLRKKIPSPPPIPFIVLSPTTYKLWQGQQSY